MKKACLTLVAAAVTAMAIAGPVLAQPYYGRPAFGRPGGWDIQRRINWMQERIIRGRDSGALDRREFDRVQGELNGIRREEHNDRVRDYGRLDDRTRADLEFRLDHLNEQIHWLREANERRPW